MRLIAGISLLIGAWEAVVSGASSGGSVLSRAPAPWSGERPQTPEWAKKDPYAPNMPKTAFTSMSRPDPSYRIYHNLWYHNTKWYALLPADNVEDPSVEDGLSPNNAVVRIPVSDMYNFTKQLRVRGEIAWILHAPISHASMCSCLSSHVTVLHLCHQHTWVPDLLPHNTHNLFPSPAHPCNDDSTLCRSRMSRVTLP
jgi:hypothetical protein